MTDPRRLSEDDEVARLLLGSAAGDMPGAEGRARARNAALASVGVGASVGLVAGGAQGAGKAVGLIALKWLAIAGVPVALATAGYLKVAHRPETPPVEVKASLSTTQPRPAQAALSPTPTPAPSVAASSEMPHPAAKPVEGAARSVPASLQKEITELDAARHALARGDVSVLDRYLAEHPRGALREQALWMKISSLQQSGRRAEASAWAKRLLAAYPNGAFAAKARALVTP